MANWNYTITDRPGSHYTEVDNANNVKDYLAGLGFGYGAIIGIIANMEHESYLNPGQQELYQHGSTSYGYGLVQWTPGTKLLNYATSHNRDWFDGDTQMDFLMINAPQSWGKRHDVSWDEFKQMTDIYYATRVFFDNFERGTWDDIMVEEVGGNPGYAPYWYQVLYGETPPEPPTPPTPEPDDKYLRFVLWASKYRKRKKRKNNGIDRIE